MKKQVEVPKKRLTYKQKKEYRVQLIDGLLQKFAKGMKNYSPTQKEINDYRFTLQTMKTKYLEVLEQPFSTKLSSKGLVDRVKSLDRRFQSQVIIIMDNGTLDTFVINDKGRTFNRKGMTYLIDSAKGRQFHDRSGRIAVYFYFQGNPHPIFFEKNKLPEGHPDATLLKRVLHFEFLQALANAVRMNKKVDIVLIIVGLNFIVDVAILLVCLKGFGFIGG